MKAPSYCDQMEIGVNPTVYCKTPSIVNLCSWGINAADSSHHLRCTWRHNQRCICMRPSDSEGRKSPWAGEAWDCSFWRCPRRKLHWDYLSSLCQLSITLKVKKYCLVFRWSLLCSRSCPFPLALVLSRQLCPLCILPSGKYITEPVHLQAEEEL